MTEERKTTLVPKGARQEPDAPVNPDDQLGLNTPQTIVDDTPNARRELILKTRKLEEQIVGMKKTNHLLSEENNRLKTNAVRIGDLEKELGQAREALTSLGDGSQYALDRKVRRFEIFKAILTGLAAKGDLFGQQVKAENLTNAINHALGVAVRSEDAALLRGF